MKQEGKRIEKETPQLETITMQAFEALEPHPLLLHFRLSEIGTQFVKNFSQDPKSATKELLASIDKFRKKVVDFQNRVGQDK